MSLSQTLRGAAARALGKSAVVSSVRQLSPSIVRVQLHGSRLQGTQVPVGAKIKLHVGGGQMRSYTPAAVDASRGTMDLVVHAHSDSAASQWARTLREGDEVAFIGPASSVAGPDGPLPWAAFYGDETTIGLAERIFEEIGDGTPRLGAIETAAADLPAVESLPLQGLARGEASGDAFGSSVAVTVDGDAFD